MIYDLGGTNGSRGTIFVLVRGTPGHFSAELLVLKTRLPGGAPLVPPL